MDILVLGHYAIDVFHRDSDPAVQRDGGILHAIAGLAATAEPKDAILPVFGVHPSDLSAVARRLQVFPAVSTKGIFPTDGPTHRVDHFSRPDGPAVVCIKTPAEPIPLERIKPYLDADAILLNMESGFDVTLETLDEIRMAVRPRGTPVHFDFHNLTLGVNSRHERVRRPLETWRRWAFMLNSIQLNEEEIAGLSLEKLPEEKAAGHLLTLGGQAVVITRGARGATLYMNQHKAVVRTDLPAPVLPDGVDATGAGDIFGAVFASEAARARDPMASLHRAIDTTAELLTARAEQRTPWSLPEGTR